MKTKEKDKPLSKKQSSKSFVSKGKQNAGAQKSKKKAAAKKRLPRAKEQDSTKQTSIEGGYGRIELTGDIFSDIFPTETNPHAQKRSAENEITDEEEYNRDPRIVNEQEDDNLKSRYRGL